LGADHPSTATSLNNLAGLYRSIGKYSEALPLYERALQIREQQLGADHPNTAISLNNLAALYYSIGKYSEALPLYERASRLGNSNWVQIIPIPL
jgi:tetratricopeptide (TPR) repeat protein